MMTVIPITKDWFVLPENKQFKIDDWLTMKEPKFELKPGESKRVKFRIHAPKKAQGELVGMLSFRTKSPTRTSVDFVMSGAVYLSVEGTEKLKGTILAFMVEPSTDSVRAGVLVRNDGNVHLRPFGNLQIVDAKDQPVANVELQSSQPVYPGKTRPYFGEVKGLPLSPGKYAAQIELNDFDRQVFIDRRKEKFTLMEDRKIKF